MALTPFQSHLIADVGSGFTKLLFEEGCQGMVYLNTDAQRFFEAVSAGGEDHKLLELKRVAGVRAAVD
ncbi:MAG: hypothetical protein RL309_606, partial [Verrucomicrobiota bacterium]